jgi:hypothetical protein
MKQKNIVLTISSRSIPELRQRAQNDNASPPRSLSVGARQKHGMGPFITNFVVRIHILAMLPARAPDKWNANCKPPTHCT